MNTKYIIIALVVLAVLYYLYTTGTASSTTAVNPAVSNPGGGLITPVVTASAPVLPGSASGTVVTAVTTTPVQPITGTWQKTASIGSFTTSTTVV